MTRVALYILILFATVCKGRLMAQTTDANVLRIITYNIKMLPRAFTFIHHHPLKRARLIPQVVAADSADIIVFEECFDYKAVTVLKKKLKSSYPYTLGPVNGKRPNIRLSGGVMMFSKVPIKDISETRFTDCKGADCWARKGALLAQFEWHGKTMQIMGTHMQAGGSKELKAKQYTAIENMMESHRVNGVPQFFCGDFNIRKGTDIYDNMLKTFGAQDGPITGELQYTSDHLLDDMENADSTKRRVIDHILYKGNGLKPVSITREVQRFQAQWDKTHKDLSDHFALLMKIKW
jgi:endonuclease/exonuclease/phosphatase family metal-dependent hydrolase